MFYALMLFALSMFLSNGAIVLLVGLGTGEDTAFPNAHIWDIIISVIVCAAALSQTGAAVMLTISIALLGSYEGVKESFSLQPFTYSAYIV